MILDVDIGNSRIKWRVSNLAGVVAATGAIEHRRSPPEWTDFETLIGVERVRLSSVAGNFTAEMVALSRRLWGAEPEVARVSDGLAGVTCGYREPERLGIDRWLAIVASWRRYHRPLLVIDAGSAVTIDVVDADGVHRGGYIFPGLDMMRRSLGSDTWAVQVDPRGDQTMEAADNTAAAVANGCALAVVGAAESVQRRAGINRMVVTGGDASVIEAHLETGAMVEVVPDLVLDGLAIALP